MRLARPGSLSVLAVLLPTLLLPSPAFAQQAFTVLVGAHRAGTLTRIDARTDALVGTSGVCRGPWGVAAAPDGRAAYAACEGEAVRVRLPDLAIAARYPLDGTGMGIAVSPDGGALYVGVHRGAVDHLLILALPGGEPLKTIPIGKRPFGLTLASDGRLYVPNHDSFSVTVIDTVTRVALRDIPVDVLQGGAYEKPHYAVVTPDASRLYLPFEGKVLAEVATATGEVRRHPLAIQAHQHGIAITRDGSHVLTVNNREGAHSLSLIRIPEAREVRRIPLASAHEQVVLSPDGRKAYLSGGFLLGGGADVVTVVDLEAGRVSASLPVPGRPLGLALGPAATP